jgi:4-amino-4-deoxy-L-arabinose transferase-like glycosyltransferase
MGLVVAVLVAVAILLNFYHLGQAHFYQHTPAQLAADVRQLNETGTWLVPTMPNGQPRLESAPLYLWAAKLSSGLRSDVQPFDTRLPAAVCSVLLILLAAFWFYQHANRYARDDAAEAPLEGFTLLAGLVVAASPVLYSVGREGTPASMFALIYLAAAYCWAESLEARRSFYAGFSPRVWLLWGYALAGLGMLVLGPLPLLLLWLPYLCAAHSYHLRKFDPIHLVGVVLALAIGAWWPLAVGLKFPESASAVWHQWLTLKSFNGLFSEDTLFDFVASPDASPLAFIGKLLLTTLPWCLVALVMIGRVWRREDRSPTLVYWTWTLLANTIVLAFVNHHFGGRLMLVPFVALLTVDGLHRWDFENGWAAAWRVILRVFIILSIGAGLFLAILLHAPVWIVIFGLVPLVWFAWVWHMRRSDVTYSRWVTTVRLAGMGVVIVTAALAMLLAEWEPRLNFNRETASYFMRVQDRLKGNTAPVYYLGDNLPGLYAFYGAAVPERDKGDTTAPATSQLPRLIHSLSQAVPVGGKAPIVMASHGVGALLAHPRMEPLALLYGDPTATPKEAMLRYLMPTTPTLATSATTALRASTRAPYYLALLGNAGTRSKNQREVGKRLDRAADKIQLHDVLLLGNNLYGPKVFDHLDFIEGFERPYRRLLKRGVVFHALLGHEDQSYAALELQYNPYHMNGHRYYSRRLAGGLVEVFMLDAQAFISDPAKRAQQEWLEKSLAASTAAWKIVALHPALATGASNGQGDEALAGVLLPICERHGVQLVAWSGGQYYERLQRKPGAPLMLNAGWSGDRVKATFKAANGHQAGVAGTAGLVLLEFTPQTLAWRAVTRRGETVDQGELSRSADVLSSGTLRPATAAKAAEAQAGQAIPVAAATPAAGTDGKADTTTATRLNDVDLRSEAAFTTESVRPRVDDHATSAPRAAQP